MGHDPDVRLRDDRERGLEGHESVQVYLRLDAELPGSILEDGKIVPVSDQVDLNGCAPIFEDPDRFEELDDASHELHPAEVHELQR